MDLDGWSLCAVEREADPVGRRCACRPTTRSRRRIAAHRSRRDSGSLFGLLSKSSGKVRPFARARRSKIQWLEDQWLGLGPQRQPSSGSSPDPAARRLARRGRRRRPRRLRRCRPVRGARPDRRHRTRRHRPCGPARRSRDRCRPRASGRNRRGRPRTPAAAHRLDVGPVTPTARASTSSSASIDGKPAETIAARHIPASRRPRASGEFVGVEIARAAGAAARIAPIYSGVTPSPTCIAPCAPKSPASDMRRRPGRARAPLDRATLRRSAASAAMCSAALASAHRVDRRRERTVADPARTLGDRGGRGDGGLRPTSRPRRR